MSVPGADRGPRAGSPRGVVDATGYVFTLPPLNKLLGSVMRTVPFLPVRLLVEPELVTDRVRKRGKRTHARSNVLSRRNDFAAGFLDPF